MAKYGPKPVVVDWDSFNENDTAPWDCRVCKRSLPFAAYYEERGCTYNRRKTCRDCGLAKMKQYRAERGIDHFRANRWLRNFGLTAEQFAEKFAAQGDCCAVCKRQDPGTSRHWHIDHDHKCCPTPGRSCGKCVRGILCHRCNLMLGQAQDDPLILSAGADYLERHGAF